MQQDLGECCFGLALALAPFFEDQDHLVEAARRKSFPGLQVSGDVPERNSGVRYSECNVLAVHAFHL